MPNSWLAPVTVPLPPRVASLHANDSIPTYNPSTGKHLSIPSQDLILMCVCLPPMLTPCSSEFDGQVLPGNGILAASTSFENIIDKLPSRGEYVMLGAYGNRIAFKVSSFYCVMPSRDADGICALLLQESRASQHPSSGDSKPRRVIHRVYLEGFRMIDILTKIAPSFEDIPL